MDVDSGGGGCNNGRGAAALALLSLRQGWAADALACAARLQPRAAGGGSGSCFAWLWQHEAAELFGRRWQGGVDGNVRTLAAAHPWMSAAVVAAAAAAGRGAALLALLGLCRGGAADASACFARLLPRAAGGVSGACFAWLALGSGR